MKSSILSPSSRELFGYSREKLRHKESTISRNYFLNIGSLKTAVSKCPEMNVGHLFRVAVRLSRVKWK